jgi:hypothetical protein
VGVTTIKGYSTAKKVYDMLLQNKDALSFLDVGFPLLTGYTKCCMRGGPWKRKFGEYSIMETLFDHSSIK